MRTLLAWFGDRLPDPLGSWLLRRADDSEEPWTDAEGRLLGIERVEEREGGFARIVRAETARIMEEHARRNGALLEALFWQEGAGCRCVALDPPSGLGGRAIVARHEWPRVRTLREWLLGRGSRCYCGEKDSMDTVQPPPYPDTP